MIWSRWQDFGLHAQLQAMEEELAQLKEEVAALREGQNQGGAGQEGLAQGPGRHLTDKLGTVHRDTSALEEAEKALRIAQEDLEQLMTELEDRRYELGLVQSTLRQREEEIAQTLAALELERRNGIQAQADRQTVESRLEALEEKLKTANQWVFRLAGERKIGEDRAAKAEARFAAAEKTLKITAAKLANIQAHQDQINEEKAELLRQKEELAEYAENLRLSGEESAQRLVQSQSEIAALSKMLRQHENDLAAMQSQLPKGPTQEHLAETRLLSNMLKTSEENADRNARRAEWLQKVNAVVTGYPHWWAFVPKKWRTRWETGRLQRRGLFDAEAYLARYPDVSASGMDPLRHYIIHGMNENRTF